MRVCVCILTSTHKIHMHTDIVNLMVIFKKNLSRFSLLHCVYLLLIRLVVLLLCSFHDAVLLYLSLNDIIKCNLLFLPKIRYLFNVVYNMLYLIVCLFVCLICFILFWFIVVVIVVIHLVDKYICVYSVSHFFFHVVILLFSNEIE